MDLPSDPVWGLVCVAIVAFVVLFVVMVWVFWMLLHRRLARFRVLSPEIFLIPSQPAGVP